MPPSLPNFLQPEELIYTLVILTLCLIIYFKTKELYELSEHEGIRFFRYTFLLFGLSYVFRFVLHIIMITFFSNGFYLPRNFVGPISIVPVSYLSTLALFFLVYSLIWRKIEKRKFLIFSNSIALVFSLVAFLTRSNQIISVLQVSLIVFIIIVLLLKKKFSQTKLLYLLIVIFWVINLLLLGPKRMLAPEIDIFLKIISIGLFSIICLKVIKWVK